MKGHEEGEKLQEKELPRTKIGESGSKEQEERFVKVIRSGKIMIWKRKRTEL